MTPAALRKVRKAAGLTQRRLADAVGLSAGFIGEMERGEKPIEKRTWLAVLFIAYHPADL